MDDQFDLNETEQFELSNLPELNPPADPPETAFREPASLPRKRRKKRKKRPSWQRLLWKYWPPIRFGLIILAGVLLIWLAISSIGSIFAGPDDPVPSDPPAPSNTSEPPVPSDSIPDPTDEPTDPPTEPPTDPPDPFAGAVSEEWYDNTLLIGDFNTAGLRDSARAGSADYFCSSNMGVFNWDEETASDDHFDDQDLESLLAAKTYDKIIINLGINNCGYPTSSLINAYSGLVNAVQNAQPEAKIILHGIMLVTSNYAGDLDYFTPSHIGSINEEIAELADGVNIYYINVNESFADASGYLLSSVSTDGCHFTTSGYEDWAKLMGVELGKLDIE